MSVLLLVQLLNVLLLVQLLNVLNTGLDVYTGLASVFGLLGHKFQIVFVRLITGRAVIVSNHFYHLSLLSHIGDTIKHLHLIDLTSCYHFLQSPYCFDKHIHQKSESDSQTFPAAISSAMWKKNKRNYKKSFNL